ncbi:MAG TPA: cell division ATP-binding protein FtsE [Clostridia bacterium]|nr:cell division ATP-binding protein FtsE [Clostridia bacterium]
MIKLLNVTKVYPNGVKALSDVSLTINMGDFVFLVGSSGAGKSTLIRLLFREEVPTSGYIMIAGKNISRLKKSEIPILRRNMGVVFQDFRLLEDRTAYENVAFAMEVLECTKKEIQERVPQVLKMVGLQERMHAYPTQLSGGEQQRVAIARAIVNNPYILIADEPTGNLDPDTSRDILKILIDINRRGTTVIMATHAWDLVNEHNRRVISLCKGVLVSDGEKVQFANEA